MLPFELKFEIAIIVAAAIIIIPYAILLVKLKQSNKISVKPQESAKKPATEVEVKKDVQTKQHVETAETEEKQKPKRDEEAKKSFFLFGERNFEGCPHKFGYLSSLPKNTPIPDECFGCSQIVECLGTLKTK